MAAIARSIIRNELLRALTDQEFVSFAPHLEMVNLPVRHILVEADQPTTDICFLESGLASVVTTSADEEAIEIGHIGREGMTGGHVILMADRTPNRTFMQVAGKGHLMPVSKLMPVLND